MLSGAKRSAAVVTRGKLAWIVVVAAAALSLPALQDTSGLGAVAHTGADGPATGSAGDGASGAGAGASKEANRVPRASLRYDGKTFEEWRRALRTELKPELRIEAIKALGIFGAAAHQKEAAADIAEVVRAYDMFDQDEWNVTHAAERALRKIGTAVAVPRLAEELKVGNENSRRFAAGCLGGFGQDAKPAMPALIEAFGDVDAKVRWQAINAAAKIDPRGRGVAEATLKAVKDEDAEVVKTAINALRHRSLKPAGLIQSLSEAVSHPDVGVRGAAVRALGELGPSGKAGVPALVAALKDRDRSVRQAAIGALGAVGPDASDAVPALVKALGEVDPGDRFLVVRALGEIGPSAKPAVSAITEFLQDKSESVRNVAAAALKKISG